MIRKLFEGLTAVLFIIVIAYSFYTRNGVLGIYLLYIAGFIAYAYAGLYMVKEYGFVGDASRIVLVVFPVLAGITIISTLVLILS